MGLLDFFRPRWRHSSPDVRREAILALPDFHHAIPEIARTDKDPSLRRLALERSEDMDLMRERVASEDDEIVRAFAERRLAQLQRAEVSGVSGVVGAAPARPSTPAKAPAKAPPVKPTAPPSPAAKPAAPPSPAAKPAAPPRAEKPKKTVASKIASDQTISNQKSKKADKFGHVRKPSRPSPEPPALQSEVLSLEEAERRYGSLVARPARPAPVAPAPAPVAPAPAPVAPAPAPVTPAPAPTTPAPALDLLDADLPDGPPPPVAFDDLDEPSDLHTAPLPAPRAPAPPRPSRDDERRKRQTERRQQEEEYRAWAVKPQFEALIARAEALSKDEAADPRRLARELRELREAWRALGRPPTEHAEALRLAFKAQLDPLSAKAKAGFEALDQEKAQTLEQKRALLGALEAAAEGPDVKAAFDLLRQTQDAWRALGPVPQEEADALGARFRAAREHIQGRRDEARAAAGAAAAARLEQLRRLVSQAEALTAARDASGAAERMKGLQQSWKSVGPTGPREEVDALWQRLRAAADAVFERRNATEQATRAANEQKKQDLINRALKLAEDGEVADPDAVIRGLQNEWRKIGPVSREANEVLWQDFREALTALRSPPPIDAGALGDGKAHLSFQPFAGLKSE